MGGEGAGQEAVSRVSRNALIRCALALVTLLPAVEAAAQTQPAPGAAGPDAPATGRLEERLRALSDRYAVPERATRDPDELRAQIARLQERRLSLIGRYTPTHPTVLQIERQLRVLREQLAAAEAERATTVPPAP